eukprot:scaffold130218_cov19-Tisochrysis_lutea.AAC.1
MAMRGCTSACMHPSHGVPWHGHYPHLDGEVPQRALAIEALQKNLTSGHDHLGTLEEDTCLLHHLGSIHAQATLLLRGDAMCTAGTLLQLLWREVEAVNVAGQHDARRQVGGCVHTLLPPLPQGRSPPGTWGN